MIPHHIFQEIKKTAVIALFSDTYLMNRLVFKGGSCLELAYQLFNRSSKDIDFSIEGEFKEESLETIEKRLCKTFSSHFKAIGYYVLDLSLKHKPRKTPQDIVMSGYTLGFKLVALDMYQKCPQDLVKLRNLALTLGSG